MVSPPTNTPLLDPLLQHVRPGVVVIETVVNANVNPVVRRVAITAAVSSEPALGIDGVLADFGPAIWHPADGAPDTCYAPTEEVAKDASRQDCCPLLGPWPASYPRPTVLPRVASSLVLADPATLCEDRPGFSYHVGGVALLAVRGECQFADKARRAAAAGASALVVANAGEAATDVWSMGGDGGIDLPALPMPALMISAQDGLALQALLAENSEGSSVTIELRDGGAWAHGDEERQGEDDESTDEDSDEEEEDSVNSVDEDGFQSLAASQTSTSSSSAAGPQSEARPFVSSFNLIVVSMLEPNVMAALRNPLLGTAHITQALNRRLAAEHARLPYHP